MDSQYIYVYYDGNMFTSCSEQSYIHILKSTSNRYTGNSRLASVNCNVIRCLRHIFFETITQVMLFCLTLHHCFGHSTLSLCVSLCTTVIDTMHNVNLLYFALLLSIQCITSLCFILHYCYRCSA